jgi:hypothetical protein
MYANAIRTAHPSVTQVSDRFHLCKGLTDALRQFALSLILQRIAVPSDTPVSGYEVRNLAAQGLNITQIRERTGHSYATVLRNI